MTGRLVLSPLLPAIIDDLSITPASAGFALSLLWALTALSQFPGGRLADRLSHKVVLVGALALMLAGGVSLVFARTYPAFLLGVAFYGVGSGLFPPATFSQLSELFVEARGQAFGVLTAGNNLGGVLASGLATVVLASSVWRRAFVPLVFTLGLVAAAVHVLNREPYVFRRVSLGVGETGRRLLDRQATRGLLAASALFAVAWQGTASFLPTFLQVEKGFSPGLASGAFAAVFAVGIVSNPLAGRLSDRFAYARVAVGAAVCGSLGLGVAIVSEPTSVVFAGVLLFAVGITGFWPPLNTYMMSLFPTESRGGDFGAARTIFIALGSLGPVYVGVVAERSSYALAFTGLVVCMLASGAVTLGAASNRPDDASRE